MNFKHLYYFWAAAKAGGIVRAGEQLHITPQTLSTQIKLLEESMGCHLFQKNGRGVELTPEGDPSKVYVGKVLRRAAVFGARKLASDDPSQRTDERVVEVVVAVDEAPLLIGQRVLVKFMKPGETAGAKRDTSIAGVPANRSMQTPARR